MGAKTDKKPEWFRKELRTKNYKTCGDAYDDAKYNELAADWNVEPSPDDQYLELVKLASQQKWIHLRLLADFMQIGRIPRVWGDPEKPVIPPDQKVRWGRVNIRILDYPHGDGAIQEHKIANTRGNGLSTAEIKTQLTPPSSPTQPGSPAFRLYVAEDLSRNAIEALGTTFGISPDFFRAHIADYAWYNVRDRWREPQPLEVVRGARDWFQVRFVTTRYFSSRECFEAALEEAKGFNILRRPDDDQSRGWWDSEEAVVALTRAKATFWVRPGVGEGETGVGVLLLDPSVSQGLPLWRGHRNFHPVPLTLDALRQDTSTWMTRRNPLPFFEDFVYWASHPDGFFPPSSSSSSSSIPPQSPAAPGAPATFQAPRHVDHLPVQTLLHLIGSEWLTMCDYIKTRLNQIELETVDPVNFSEDKGVDLALTKLHMWRRFIPLYREMVSETLLDVFRFPCYAVREDGGGSVGPTPSAANPQSTGRSRSSSRATSSTADAAHTAAHQGNASSIHSYEQDLKLVLAYLQEHQVRIDRLTSVVTAVMAVNDTRRANVDARNIGRLTWLATFFLPFSIVSGIFSMQKLSDMSIDTIRVYFATTLPLAILAVVFAWTFPAPLTAIQAWLGRLRSRGWLSGLRIGHS